jgi:outer membrane protein assembly factor BamA
MPPVVLAALVWSLIVGPPQSTSLQIAAINVDGERRYTPAEVVRSSGLVAGRRVTRAELGAALKRMAETGLYKSVNYRTVTNGTRTTIVLEIEEADWTIPVELENFAGVTDAELKTALRAKLFSFDGKVPNSPGIPQLIVSELQKLLKAKNLSGEVEFFPRTTEQLQVSAYVFRIKDSK